MLHSWKKSFYENWLKVKTGDQLKIALDEMNVHKNFGKAEDLENWSKLAAAPKPVRGRLRSQFNQR